MTRRSWLGAALGWIVAGITVGRVRTEPEPGWTVIARTPQGFTDPEKSHVIHYYYYDSKTGKKTPVGQ